MALWFLRGVRRGIVTTRYPARTDAWTADLPTPPAFRPALLTRSLADRLVSACPAGALTRDALTRDGSQLVIDLGACSGCQRCIEIAGDAAAPSGTWELAVHDRRALIKRVPIRGRER
jgi:NAD-dependent dihydropyrimidine dehydrogenase PreA subunit